MLHRHPVRLGEFVNDSIATKTPDTAVLLATEGSGCTVIHAGAIDVRHSRLALQRKTQAAPLARLKTVLDRPTTRSHGMQGNPNSSRPWLRLIGRVCNLRTEGGPNRSSATASIVAAAFGLPRCFG